MSHLVLQSGERVVVRRVFVSDLSDVVATCLLRFKMLANRLAKSSMIGKQVAMTIDRRDIYRIVKDLKSAGTDTQDIEVKESVRKLPVSLVETLSAFSNATGGTLILGLSEADGFIPVEGFRAKAMADALATISADKMVPPVRPEINIVEYSGAQLVVAQIPECIPRDKPCYVAERGVYHGSFIRVADGDRKLSSYEIDRLLENRLQPAFDAQPVEQAGVEDLDQGLVQAVLARQRELHPRIFSAFSDDEALLNLHVLARDGNGQMVPTLAGLLALGVYPQRFFPRLTVVFTAYESEHGSDYETKFLDAQTMAGPIPAVLEDTIAAVQKNMRDCGRLSAASGAATEPGLVTEPGSVTETSSASESEPAAEASSVADFGSNGTALRFPLGAVREAVANALIHRDYSPSSYGAPVHVELYPDRIEVTNPGGLYGALTVDDLNEMGYSPTRNQFLSTLLESVPFQDGYMVESRGTGYRLIQQELARAGLPRPETRNSIALFTVVMRTMPAGAKAAPIGETGDDLLAVLASMPDASAAELAARTGLARSTVSYRLRKLEAQGLVKRIGEVRSPKQRYRLARRV